MFGPVLIPAAGLSVRMGRPKLLLPLGGHSILERILNAARLGGIGRAIVVVRPDDTELTKIARRAGADVVILPTATPDMRATALAGLDWIETHFPSGDRPGFFLIPADHPVLTPEVFRALTSEIAGQSGSIVVPAHAGRRGHPVWIAWSHAPALRQIPEGQGFNVYLRSQASATVEIPWPTPEILIDLDTPADYERLVRNYGDGQTPAPTFIASSGELSDFPPNRPAALLPGSFNPLHAGHLGLATAAREILGADVQFELSRRNVDKPELSDEEVARRVAQFRGRADLWVTHSPRFVEKAVHFPGAVFVVGADTAARLTQVRYYEGDVARLDAAFEAIRERECRFLVAARSLDRGELLALDDLPIPSRWRPMFAAIPTDRFRLDICSTDLRRREGPP